MSRPSPLLALAAAAPLALLAAPAGRAQTPNLKDLSEAPQFATRASLAPHRVFFMQDPNGRTGFGRVLGVRAALQDSDGATSEVVSFGFVRYGAGIAPDVSTAGRIAAVTVNTPSGGSGNVAYALTVTFAAPAVSPPTNGIDIALPAATATDALSLQVSDPSALLPSTPRVQRTYLEQRGAALAYLASGATIRAWGLYEEGVARAYRVPSMSTRIVYGGEAYDPSSTLGDGIGFELEHRGFGGAFVIPLVAPGRMTPALNFGTLGVFHLPFTATVLPAQVLDGQGWMQSPVFRIPPRITYALQGCFADPRNGRLRLGDAITVTTH